MSLSSLHLEDRFGELRSAAHSLRGDARWQQLIALLEDWRVYSAWRRAWAGPQRVKSLKTKNYLTDKCGQLLQRAL